MNILFKKREFLINFME